MKKKILLCIFILILTILIIFTVIKIKQNIEKENNKKILIEIKEAYANFIKEDNYSYENTQYLKDGKNTTFRKMIKDNKIAWDGEGMILYGNTETGEVYQYSKETNEYYQFNDEESELEMSVIKMNANLPILITTIMTKNIEDLKVKIENDAFENINCYKIIDTIEADKNWSNITWIDKNTLLPIRYVVIDNDGNIFNEYRYKLTIGDVKDSDVNFEK